MQPVAVAALRVCGSRNWQQPAALRDIKPYCQQAQLPRVSRPAATAALENPTQLICLEIQSGTDGTHTLNTAYTLVPHGCLQCHFGVCCQVLCDLLPKPFVLGVGA